jgi:CheY-like chemotaxis protein
VEKHYSTFDTILYVDEDADDRTFFKEALRENKIQAEIYFFKDGAHILKFMHVEILPRNPIVFLDPKNRGCRYVKKIRSLTRKEVPIVIYTTSQNKEDIRHCYENGANLYVPKPFSNHETNHVIHKIFQLDWRLYFPQPLFEDFVLKEKNEYSRPDFHK